MSDVAEGEGDGGARVAAAATAATAGGAFTVDGLEILDAAEASDPLKRELCFSRYDMIQARWKRRTQSQARDGEEEAAAAAALRERMTRARGE